MILNEPGYVIVDRLPKNVSTHALDDTGKEHQLLITQWNDKYLLQVDETAVYPVVMNLWEVFPLYFCVLS